MIVNTDRINLCWELDGDQYQMFFGYLDGEASCAVFKNDTEEPVMIPKEVLQIAFEQGWDFIGNEQELKESK